MPSYKLERFYIERAIASVLAQELEDWELVYVDDNPAGSPCKEVSRQLAAEYADDPRMRFIFHEDNMGANCARNDAIAAASGEWLAFLDADDYWDECYLQNVADKAASGDYALVCTAYRIQKEHGCREFVTDCPDGFVYERAIMAENVFGSSSCVCARKETLLAEGSFDESLPACQDYDMFLRISKAHPVGFCREIATNYCDEDHARISSSMLRRAEGTMVVVEKILADEDLAEETRQQAAACWYRVIGRNLVIFGNGHEARKYLRRNSDWASRRLYLISYFAALIPYIRLAVNRVRYR